MTFVNEHPLHNSQEDKGRISEFMSAAPDDLGFMVSVDFVDLNRNDIGDGSVGERVLTFGMCSLTLSFLHRHTHTHTHTSRISGRGDD